MGNSLTVRQLIEHLSKYPGKLIVSVYRPPFSTAYRVMAPVKGADNKWLYNTRRLYVPIEETQTVTLPGNYKIPALTGKRRSTDDN